MNITTCAPPSCSCFGLETYDDIDGNKMVAITDSTGGVVIDTVEAFHKLVGLYMIECVK
jgi:hypothetical protein